MRQRRATQRAPWGVWILALACALCAACDSPARPGVAAIGPEDGEIARVRLVPVESRSMERAIEVTGAFFADEEVTLSSNVAGRVVSLGVDIGTQVKAGQIIARIDPERARLSLQQALAALAQVRAQLGLGPESDASALSIDDVSSVRAAQATLSDAASTLERSKGLRQRSLISAAELETAQTAFLRAEAALGAARDDARVRQASLQQRAVEVALARQALSDTTIRAPFDGTVLERLTNLGAYVSAATPIARLVRVDPVRFRCEVSELEAALVQVGQTLRLEVQGTLHEGRVARVAPALSPDSRTLLVESMLANDGRLRPGSFARGKILVDTEQVLGVPEAALVTFAGIEKVLRVEQERIVEQRVKTGRRGAGFVEIVEGLAPEQEVVAAPLSLQQGQKVLLAK